MRMFGRDYVMQHDLRDCAAACLTSVCNLYGIRVSLLRIRELLMVDKNGSSMYAIKQVAEKIGFAPEVLQGDFDELIQEVSERTISCPLICHMHIEKQEHFVILKKISSRGIFIFDPGRGHKKYTQDLFQSQWTGYVVSLKLENAGKSSYRGRRTHCEYVREILSEIKGKLVCVLIISFLLSAISVGYSYIYQRIIDQFILQQNTGKMFAAHGFKSFQGLIQQADILLQHLPFLFGCMVFVLVFQFLFGMIRGRLMSFVEKSVDLDLSKRYVKKLFALPFSYFSQWDTGEIMSRYQDMAFIRDVISGSVLTIAFETVIAVAGFILLVKINFKLFLIILIMMAVYLAVILFFRKPMRRMNREIMESDAKVTSGIKEGIDGVEAVKLYQQEESFGKNIFQKMCRNISAVYKTNLLYVAQSELLSLIQGIGTLAVLCHGTYCVIQGDMTLGSLFLFVSLMNYFVSPVKNLIGLQPQFQEALIAGDRLNDVLAASSEQSFHPGKLCGDGERMGDICFENISFRYGYHNWILKGLDFIINEGEHTALTGTNGSGKSTLAKLLVGMYEPSEGRIRIGRQNLADLNLSYIRSHVIYVSQQPVFLSGTIRETLLFGRKELPNDKTIEKVVCGCCLNEMISQNPFGYDRILAENGANISGGQRQRLAIARALLAEPDILILDEATSQIDREREMEILKFVFQYREGKTIVVISHNEKIIQMCDREIRIGNQVSVMR